MGNVWNYAVAAVCVVGLAIIVTAAPLFRRWRTAQAAEHFRRAMREFAGRRTELTARFLQAAEATGKPRGLRWKSCDFAGPPLFAIDEGSSELVALVAVTVSFAAIEGGEMEEVEAVGNLRSATAVFVDRHGQWTTDGRVIFNLEPVEAVRHYQGALRPINEI